MRYNIKEKAIEIKSYAKVNIGLNIIDRLSNGYHKIETLIQEINFYDIITIEISLEEGGIDFSSTGNRINCENKKNSCYLILQLLKEKYHILNKIKIHLHKNISIGAGVGGGSGNAGSILNFIDYYFNLKMSIGEKTDVCQTIGMDVPFFINGKLQYAENMGEKLTLLPNLFTSYYFLLVYPEIKISTQWAYANIKKQLPVKKLNYNLLALKPSINWSAFRNDFEKVVIPRYPEIGEIKQKMIKNNAIYSSLSGSGSTVFGIYRTLDDAVNARDKIKKSKYQTIVAQPIE